jgi:BirA family biotin operon repressor/biotin-[acetyl-CoA-carboxylase] ligase
LISFTVETLRTVASTNDIASERARAGAAEGLVIRALMQQAGRGRHGRHWVSPAGNLYASLLLRPSRPLHEAASLSLVIGLCLAEALAQVPAATPLEPRLKWPNDVRIGGAKIAGILLEGSAGPATAPVIIAGIGVNVAVAPADMPYPVTSLYAQGASLPPETLLARLLEGFAHSYEMWQLDGFASLRQRWLDRADGLGAMVTLRHGETAIDGRFVDVDAAGHLLLETRNGLKTLSAGELFFVPAAVGA